MTFHFPRSGKAVTEQIDRPKQQIAILLQATKPVFHVGEAFDLGNQQAECLNIRAPIEHGMVGKIPQHFDRNRAQKDGFTIVQIARNAPRLDIELPRCYPE